MSRLLIVLSTLCVLLPSPLPSQNSFDLQAYRDFLATHRQLSGEGILRLYPAGSFADKIPGSWTPPEYLDLIRSEYQLTAYEESLLVRNGFMVTERVRQWTFGQGFLQLWRRDLPVFISSDALLHAVHRSYDAILMDVELQVLASGLDRLLASMHGAVPAAVSRYGNDPRMGPSLLDVDLYCTVARRLLGRAVQPVFMSQIPAVDSLLKAVADAQVLRWRLFGTTPRTVDFSQFTPRGHYTKSDSLKRYFQAMIWLGRTELYLLPPRSDDPQPRPEEIQRQCIDAMLLTELAAGAGGQLAALDRTIRMFVGEQDNVTADQAQTLARQAGIASAADLADTTAWRRFQDTLLAQPFAFQRINSQILLSDPASPDTLRPASAFMLLGQRFVVDSYVFCNVVYDRVRSVPFRMIPSVLDVLAALGNDAALQLLQPEFGKYTYAPNLAALRYLIEGYDPGFWGSSLYNGWLHAVQALNPPRERAGLPAFMQTAAWWQHSMNTQLASWTELRHDNLLYAKQSYTGGTTCSCPEAYLEPVPELYRRLKVYADSAGAFLAAEHPGMSNAINHFRGLSAVADTLTGIAVCELQGVPLAEFQRTFLRSGVYESSNVCGAPPSGWYVRIHYTGANAFDLQDLVVADVHTIPTDENGSMVGWVLHAGTGPLNLAVVNVRMPDGREAAFAGPVSSYYERMTSGFNRLTDEEWAKTYGQAPAARPPFVNLFLADYAGGSRGAGPKLLTGADAPDDPVPLPAGAALSPCYPNPFNGETTLHMVIPPQPGSVAVDLAIYSIHGQCVRHLLKEPLPAGTYAVRWDGRNESGGSVASGIYFGILRSAGGPQVRKLVLIR